MTRRVTIRLPEDAVEALDSIADEERIDRAALVRKMLLEDIEEHRLDRALDAYRRGEKSVGAAAADAGVSIWEFVDRTVRDNVQPPPSSAEDLEQELENALSELGD